MRDKYLIAIVAGIILLVVVAFVVVLVRPEAEYRTDDSPESSVHNYLLAVRRQEYERAYDFLSPTLPGYPENLAEFRNQIERNRYSFALNEDVALDVQSATITGESATVRVLKTTFHGGGIFDGGQSNRQFTMQLIREGEAWKLVDGDQFWVSCWDRGDCR